jgi:uncharacterized protein
MSADRVVITHPDGAALAVCVVPGARRTEIVGFYGDALRVRVAAAPERGRANKAVIALLAAQLGCRFRLVSGASSRRKRFVALGITTDDLVSRIEQIVN